MADKEELLSGINFISQETLDGISETDDSKLYLMEKTVLDNGSVVDFTVQSPLELTTTSNPNIVNASYTDEKIIGTWSGNNNFTISGTSVTGNGVPGVANRYKQVWTGMPSYVDIPFNYKTDLFYGHRSNTSGAVMLGYMTAENEFKPLFALASRSGGYGTLFVHLTSINRNATGTNSATAEAIGSSVITTEFGGTYGYFGFYTDGSAVYTRNAYTNTTYFLLSDDAVTDLNKVTTLRVAPTRNTNYQEGGVFRWPYDQLINETEWQTPEGLGLQRVYPPDFTEQVVLKNNLTSYTSLTNLPTINGIPIAGEVSFDNLGLQKDITPNAPLTKSEILHDTYVGMTISNNKGSSSYNTYANSTTRIPGVEKVNDTLVRPYASCVILPYSSGQTVLTGNLPNCSIIYGKLNTDGTFLPVVCNATNVVSIGTASTSPVYVNITTNGGTAVGQSVNASQLVIISNNSATVAYYNSSSEHYLAAILNYTWSDSSRNYNDINAVLIAPSYNTFTNWDMSSVGVYSPAGLLYTDFDIDMALNSTKVAGIDTENSVQYLDLKIDNQTIQVNSNGELCANLDEIGGDITDINSALGGFAFKSMTQAEYEALATKDAATLYVTTGTTPGLYFGSAVIVQGAT